MKIVDTKWINYSILSDRAQVNGVMRIKIVADNGKENKDESQYNLFGILVTDESGNQYLIDWEKDRMQELKDKNIEDFPEDDFLPMLMIGGECYTAKFERK